MKKIIMVITITLRYDTPSAQCFPSERKQTCDQQGKPPVCCIIYHAKA